MIYFSIFVSFFFFFIFSIETIGYSFKGLGRQYNLPSMGYSIHVQVATFARAFSFFAFPLVGFMLDSSVDIKEIIVIPALSSLLFIFSFILFYVKNDYFFSKLDSFFLTYIKKLYGLNNVTYLKHNGFIDKADYTSIFIASSLAFFITTFGIFFTLILACLYHDYRATILQSSAVLTSAGTLLSVFYLDPKLSKLVDANFEFKTILQAIYLSRLCSMILIFIMSIIFLYVKFF